MPANIRRDYLWNTTGVLLQSLISPVLLVIIAHVNGQLDVGLFAFAFAVAVAFWVVAMWGGRTYQVSDVKKEFSSVDYILTRLVLITLTFIAAVFFCIANGYPTDKTALIIGLVVFKLVETISDVYYGVIQTRNSLYIAGISLIIKSVLGLALFTIVDVLTGSILLAVLALIIVNLLVFFIYDLVWAGRLEPGNKLPLNLGTWIRRSRIVLVTCGSVFVVSFLVTFSLNIPRYFIDLQHPEQNPFFGVIAMPVTLILLVITFIIQPNVVRLSKLYNAGKKKEFNGIIGRIGLIVVSAGVVALMGTYLIGAQVLTIIFGIDFSPYVLDLCLIVIGATINACVALEINLLTIMRRLKGATITLIATNLALIPLSYYIVQKFGMIGGIALFLGVSSIQLVILYVLHRKYMGQNG